MKEFELKTEGKLSPEEEARVKRVMDSDFTGLYIDPGKQERLLPNKEKSLEPKAPKRG